MAFAEIRMKTPCRFNDGISRQEFETFAYQLGKRIQRITNISVAGAMVSCTVESQKHISEWRFIVDFNDWGHVTGTFWQCSENSDSSIPHNFGMAMSDRIHHALYEKNIHIDDLSDAVDNHDNLDQLITNGIHNSRGFWKYVSEELLGHKREVVVKQADWDMRGEHLYPIFARLIDYGFRNICAQEIKDIDASDNFFEYEVAKISIDGATSFESGRTFEYDSEVIVAYHVKKEIVIPFPILTMFRQNYIIVGDRLQGLGFTEIYEKKIKDLVAGIIVKDGATEKVVVERPDGIEVPIQNGRSYPYDTNIIIYYHTFN